MKFNLVNFIITNKLTLNLIKLLMDLTRFNSTQIKLIFENKIQIESYLQALIH